MDRANFSFAEHGEAGDGLEPGAKQVVKVYHLPQPGNTDKPTSRKNKPR